MSKIAVIGAGINGVSSALAIQEKIPGAQVTIISEKFSPNTTSDVAAGLIEPYLCDDNVEKIIKWTRATINRIQEYMAGGNAGAEEMSGYWIQSVKEVPKWLKVMKNVNVLNEQEMKQIAKRPEHKFGVFYSTWYLEPTPYIKWETEQFLKNGGKIIQQKVEKLEDLKKDYDIIVNCSGLGSRHLVKDQGTYPTRGQVIKVSCPRVKHFFIDDSYYALLNEHTITLGGTKDQHQWDRTINTDLAQKIFEGNCVNVPSLRSARIISHHVDLRPSRATVRLEVDSMDMKLVHNYGHGGSGITLHWGCALECAELVEKIVKGEKAKL